MIEPPVEFDYDTLHDTLARAGAVIALPELHGGVCGALCGGGGPAAERWLDDCFRDQDLSASTDLQSAVHEILAVSWRMLEGDELAFAPLLPSDDSALDEQVQALGLWCHGFLGGIGASAPDVGRAATAASAVAGSAPVAIDEIFADFVEISRAGLSEDEAGDRDGADFALAELTEYIRVSVQIVFEELAGRRAAAGSREIH